MILADTCLASVPEIFQLKDLPVSGPMGREEGSDKAASPKGRPLQICPRSRTKSPFRSSFLCLLPCRIEYG